MSVTLSGNSSGWWIFGIVAIFVIIGVVVFVLRKKIPGLAEYDKEDESKIAEDNLSRILVDVDDESELKDDIDEEKEELDENKDGENK